MKVDCSVWYPSFATSTWRPFINTVFPEYSLSSLCMENSSSSMRTWFQYLLFWKANCSPEHSPDGFNFPLIWSCFLLEQQTLTTWPRYPKLLVCNNSLQVAGERMMGTSNSNVVIPPWRRSTICAQETAVLVLFTLHSKVRIFCSGTSRFFIVLLLFLQEEMKMKITNKANFMLLSALN